MPDKLAFMSYNICHGYGLDKKMDITRAADVINQYKPDCVALQEVDLNVPRSQMQDEMAVLAKLTSMNGFFGKAIDLSGGEYGVGILTSEPATPAIHIPLPGKEPRTLLAVDTTTRNGLQYRFACTHFDLNLEEQIASAHIVSNELAKSSLPFAFMGDFNCQPSSEPYGILSQAMTSACPGWIATHPANAPEIAIDHCFLNKGTDWSEIQAVAIDEEIVSDHRPFMVWLTLG